MKLVSLENLSKYNELLSQKTVRSVNSIKPDSNGNVQLGTEKSTFNKVVYDTGYFSIGTNATYNFDLTGSDLENVSKENVNIRLIAKVVTAHSGFEVGDIAQLTTAVDHVATNGDLDICSYIRGNIFYLYSGNNSGLSIRNGTNWLQKSNVQIKAVLTAFIPDDGSILLIAEDQTNTSKLIGLPDGTLTWNDKNLVRSVNGVNADESGNVTINAVADSTVLKGNISTYAFPSEKNVVLTIPASKTTLTAPANGWFVYLSTGGGTTNDYMFMSNITTAYYGCQTRDIAGRGISVNCPAKKGESVFFEWVDSGTTKNLKFVYATDQNIEE